MSDNKQNLEHKNQYYLQTRKSLDDLSKDESSKFDNRINLLCTGGITALLVIYKYWHEINPNEKFSQPENLLFLLAIGAFITAIVINIFSNKKAAGLYVKQMTDLDEKYKYWDTKEASNKIQSNCMNLNELNNLVFIFAVIGIIISAILITLLQL